METTTTLAQSANVFHSPFDLDGLDTRTLSENGADMTVHKVGSREPMLDRHGKPVVITLLGPDSDDYRNSTRAQMRKRLERAAAVAEKKQEPLSEEQGYDEAENDALEVIVLCTVRWSGVNDREGNPIPCTPGNARALYAHYPVIRDQVETFITQRSNFLLASPGG